MQDKGDSRRTETNMEKEGQMEETTAILTVLTVSPREAAETHTLVGVQLGVAEAAVVARLLRTGVVLEHGHVAGAQGVLLSEDGGTHQNDLGAEDTGLKRPLIVLDTAF